MKKVHIPIAFITVVLLTLPVACKKDKIDIDISLLTSTTWELYNVVLRDPKTGTETNANDIYLSGQCDTSYFTFYEDGSCTEKLCYTRAYVYTYNKDENILSVNYESGVNIYYFRIDELTADQLKLVSMHYENGDTAEEAGVAWYYRAF